MKITKTTFPLYRISTTDHILPQMMESVIVDQLAKLIRKQSRTLAKQLLEDYQIVISTQPTPELKQEIKTELRKKTVEVNEDE